MTEPDPDHPILLCCTTRFRLPDDVVGLAPRFEGT
jgi:hypothetical protein